MDKSILRFDSLVPNLPDAVMPSVEYMSVSYLFALGFVLYLGSPNALLRSSPIIPPEEVCGPPLTDIYSKLSDSPYPPVRAVPGLESVPHSLGENTAYPVVRGYILSNIYLSKKVDSLSNLVTSALVPSYGNC